MGGDSSSPPNRKLKMIEEENDGGASNFEIMGGISDDLLFEILIRFSDQRLTTIQCSLVCKRWRGLILSDEFVRRIRSATTLLIQVDSSMITRRIMRPRPPIVDRKPLSSFKSYFNFIPEPGSMTVEASFNDLLLVTTDSTPTNLYICNPFTQQWFLLPKPPLPSICSRYGLSCEEDKKNKLFKFKVLLVQDMLRRSEAEPFHYIVAIFRSETGEWRRSKQYSSLKRIRSTYRDEVVFSNGKFYWLQISSKGLILFAFEPDVGLGGRRQHLYLPKDIGARTTPDPFLGVSEGRLRIVKVDNDRNKQEQSWKVWESKERKKGLSWSLVHERSYSYSSREEEGKTSVKDVEFVCFHPENGDVVFTSSDVYRRVFHYNLRKGTVEEILDVVKRDDVVNFRRIASVELEVTLSKGGWPAPTPFHLTRLTPPTPLPTLPSST
ncbi:hypothetical protein CsatB_011848 [Cannabis sativa]